MTTLTCEITAMTDADQFLADARKSFRLAADSTEAKSVERYARLGLDYFQLAHEAAQLAIVSIRRRGGGGGHDDQSGR